ncbi:MAG: hypothetical protein R3Y13_04075 [bacterium]
MKKKLLIGLMAVFMMVPMFVQAAASPDLVYTQKVSNDGTVVTKDITLTIKVGSGDDITINESTPITVGVVYPTGIEFTDSDISSVFSVSQSGDKFTLTYDGMEDYVIDADNNLELGTFTFVYDSAEIEDDCTIKFDTSLGSKDIIITQTTTTNPDTGINIPVIAIGTAGVVTVGLYLVIGRKNKIYNI